MSQSLNTKVKTATKWSTITEIMAKLVSPLTTMLLARLLTPEAFGIVATITMVISFADIFADAGFNKYIIQHEFSSDEERVQCTNVAFWSNLSVSILLWVIIFVFSTPLAKMVGCPGYELGLIVACAAIPTYAFSSIQASLYKRNFDFKTLFVSRIISVLVPLLITAPLAFFLRNYWALVLGNLARSIILAVYLTIKSPWKPAFYYNWTQLKSMLSFSIWTLLESISIWLTHYADVFIVGTLLNQYYLGIYRTSMATVGGITGMVTAATTPVLFSTLSRLQNDRDGFYQMFFTFQKMVSILVVPIGVGIFVFGDVVTKIMLGDQWNDAIGFIGLWGLMATITILFSHYASEVYRSMGKPKLSFIAQWLHIIVLVPVVYVFANKGYDQLYVARSLVRLESVLVDCLMLYFIFGISTWRMTKNVFPAFLASAIMMVAGFGLRLITHDFWWNILFIVICTGLYFLVLSRFKVERNMILRLKEYALVKFFRKSANLS